MSTRTLQMLVAGLVMFSVAACSSSSGDGGGGGGGGTSTGTVTGTVVDATSGLGVASISVADLLASLSTTTSSTGTFTLSNVPAGTRTITFSGGSYSTMTRTVTVTAGQTTSLGSVATNPALSGNTRRFVLSWGADPSDLDFYLVAPDGSVAWFGDNDPLENTSFFLDNDETSGYGPETMTINSYQSGTYRLLVNDYSNGGGDPTGADTFDPSELGSSGATIQEYTSAGLLNTYTVPACSSTGYWWNVLTLTTTDTVGPGTVASVNTCVQDVSLIVPLDASPTPVPAKAGKGKHARSPGAKGRAAGAR